MDLYLKPFHAYFSDIRFWIILFFLLRLYGITYPPLEVAHNWRQVTVNMPARNFLETGPDIFYPRVDFAGEKTGITGMEFPLLNYLIYLVSLVFGYAHWYGRLINLIVSSVGLWFFYLLIKKYFSAHLAFKATFILLFSVWFTYSRKIMPDTFSMSLVIMGIYYANSYFDGRASVKNILFYFVFFLFGTLSKLPSGYLLVLIVPQLFKAKPSPFLKLIFVITTVFILLIVGIYYFIWVPYLTEHFGFSHFFMGGSTNAGLRELIEHWPLTFEKFYLEALQIIGFVFFVTGVVYAIVRKERLLLLVLALAFFAYLIVIIKAGLTFARHSYYIIPFAPIMALLAAYGIEAVAKRRVAAILLALILIESIANKFHDFHFNDNHAALLRLEPVLDSIGERQDLIYINSEGVPTPMYFAHRKGWIGSNEKVENNAVVNELKTKGLTYIVILKKVFGRPTKLPYSNVYENNDFTVYKP